MDASFFHLSRRKPVAQNVRWKQRKGAKKITTELLLVLTVASYHIKSKVGCGRVAGKSGSNKPVHMYRQDRASATFVRAGVSGQVAMRITGHKTRSIFGRYNITSERDLHDAARKLDDYFAKQDENTEAESATSVRLSSVN